MGLLRQLGAAVVLLAVALGTVGKVQPEVFLKLPGPFGFLLYHFVGGKFLPPFMDNTPFLGANFFEWAKDGDVLVSTGGKTGTTWLCYCSDAVRRRGSDRVGLPFADIMRTTPWMEFATRPGETWAERKELYNTTTLPDGTKLKDYWDNPAFPFRIFKSHFLPVGTGDPYQSVLPVSSARKVKFISAMRKPEEFVKSVFSFFPNHAPEFARMWGGFPPSYDTIDAVVKDFLPGRPLEGLYLTYNMAWWQHRHDPNVLLLHYSDMVKDLDGLVSKLAAFLDVQLSASEFAAVKEKCSYQHMKTTPEQFDYELLFGSDKVAGTPTIMQSGRFIAKNKFSTGKREWSAESKKLWGDTLKKELEPALLNWLQEGGSMPP